VTFQPDPYGDRTRLGLPTAAELAEMAARRRRTIAGPPRRPWPEERPDPYLTGLRYMYPNPARIALALRLALDLETAQDLLAGRPVDPDRLDAAALERARTRRLVRLDVAEIDLLLEATP
jgi:hypothetical protein